MLSLIHSGITVLVKGAPENVWAIKSKCQEINSIHFKKFIEPIETIIDVPRQWSQGNARFDVRRSSKFFSS